MAITSILDSNGTAHAIEDERVVTATTSNVGMVKPDGTTITIDSNGVISADGNPFSTDSDGYIVFG